MQFGQMLLAATKMFYRDKRMLFFSLFIPLVIMSIFGVMDFDKFGTVKLGLVNNQRTEISKRFGQTLEKIKTFQVSQGTEEAEKKALDKGDRDMVLVLPDNFGQFNPRNPQPQNLTLYYNQGRSDRVGAGTMVLEQILSESNFQITKTPRLFNLEKKSVSSQILSYIDFLVPGIAAMMIMQLGIIGVSALITSFKEEGILKRLRATPIQPSIFLFSQVFTRLILLLAQVGVVLVIGIAVFKMHLIGNPLNLVVISILGGIGFLSIGFAISGIAKTRDTAITIAQLIQMPMMFLSGVFFPRESMPEALQKITDYLPLSYLVHAMRELALTNATLLTVQTDVVALAIWAVIGFVLAVKFFRWE
ncbi:MAG: ABC transporter permease [Patescibacteria group bacterium]|nr:ABC transporter permease [Patescibacteria group bacterium]